MKAFSRPSGPGGRRKAGKREGTVLNFVRGRPGCRNGPQSPAIAVKAFIVKNGKALFLRRRPDDVRMPGTWDIPGGRLAPWENPVEGLKREALAETGLRISAGPAIGLHHFVRYDGQPITMIIFLCRPAGGRLRLSEEHTEYDWADAKAKSTSRKLPKFKPLVEDYAAVYSKMRKLPEFFHSGLAGGK